MLSKHRHHVPQRTHGFCANLTLGCRQYRPHGSRLSSQNEEMMGEEGQRSKEDQVSVNADLFIQAFLFFLSHPSFQARFMDRALRIDERKAS